MKSTSPLGDFVSIEAHMMIVWSLEKALSVLEEGEEHL
jgi:hypothetical protein